MNNITIARDELSTHYTIGRMRIDDSWHFHTIENPWVDNLPFFSCVPDGHYDLIPYKSPSYGNTFALVNPVAGVFLTEQDAHDAGWETMPDMDAAREELQKHEQGGYDKKWARYLVLIHVANWSWNVEGCIGLGISRAGEENTPDRMVTNSGHAMDRFFSIVDSNVKHELMISKVYRR